MTILLAFAAAALAATTPDHVRAAPSPAAVTANADATVRILQPAAASSKQWSQPGGPQKREILVREADGRLTRLRLIEHE